ARDWGLGRGDPSSSPWKGEARRWDLPICFHQGTGMPDIRSGPDFSYGRFQRLPLSVVNAFYSFVTNSVPDRFPRLRLGFVEAGASWVPYVVYDLNRRVEKQPAGSAIDGIKFETKDDLLVQNRCFVTCQVDD